MKTGDVSVIAQMVTCWQMYSQSNCKTAYLSPLAILCRTSTMLFLTTKLVKSKECVGNYSYGIQ